MCLHNPAHPTMLYYTLICSTMLFFALLYEATISPPFPLISCWRPGHHLFKSITEQHQTLENVLFQNHRKHYIYRQSLGNILSGTPLDGVSLNVINIIIGIPWFIQTGSSEKEDNQDFFPKKKV